MSPIREFSCQFLIRSSSWGSRKSLWNLYMDLIFENMCCTVSGGNIGCARFSWSTRNWNTWSMRCNIFTYFFSVASNSSATRCARFWRPIEQVRSWRPELSCSQMVSSFWSIVETESVSDDRVSSDSSSLSDSLTAYESKVYWLEVLFVAAYLKNQILSSNHKIVLLDWWKIQLCFSIDDTNSEFF